jgi:Putative metal-binding motif
LNDFVEEQHAHNKFLDYAISFPEIIMKCLIAALLLLTSVISVTFCLSATNKEPPSLASTTFLLLSSPICTDADSDGFYAEKNCKTLVDCNDNDQAIYPMADEVCNELDDDCDGTVDEGCDCVNDETRSCGNDVGECTAGFETCVNGAWNGVCVGEITPVPEVCDGLDNDCNSSLDDGLTAPPNSMQNGVCNGSTQSCSGPGGWVDDYTGIATYEAGSETSCDARDNDCDGTVDEGCDCVNDETRSCGNDVGECTAGFETCVNGAWNGVCVGEITPVPEVCDGLDNDCNGSLDDGLTAPPNSMQNGVCNSSTQSCSGPGGWVDDYTEIATYEAGSETSCDALDNDCDAEVDEGCDCSFDNSGGENIIENNASTLVYEANNSFAILNIEMHLPPSGSGTYIINSNNYNMCTQCILITEDDGSGGVRYFLSDSGTLVISSWDTTFTGTLSAYLVEVTIDPNTFESLPVPDGGTKCLDNYLFNANF